MSSRRRSIKEERFPRAVESEAPANYVMLTTGGNALTAQSQGTTNANGVCLAAVALQVKFGRVFRAYCNVYFADDTTGMTIEHSLLAIPYVAPASRFSTGTAVNVFFGNDVGQDLSSNGDWGANVNADTHGNPANGIFFNGAAVNAAVAGTQVLAHKTVASLTGLLSSEAPGIEEFCWSGRLVSSNAGGVKVNYTRFNFVVLALVLNSLNQVVEGADVITYQHVSIGLEEEPYP